MRRIAHGDTSPLEPPEDGVAPPSPAGSCARGPARFDYLFPDLAETPEALLPEGPETLDKLAKLGASMSDKGTGGFSHIPSAYTYFGQFVDHDITFTCTPKNPPGTHDSCVLANPNLAPLPVDFIREQVTNQRTSVLQLDTIYGGKMVLDDNDKKLLRLGKTTPTGYRLPHQDEVNDLPRGDDRVALIGDRRNDQHLILAQLHVAFLRAHNQIVRQENCSFDEAQTLLRKHYHWIILNDFLKKQVADEDTVEAVIAKPTYKPNAAALFLPLEFTVAAFRFGHSMVRNYYNYNHNYNSRDLADLFTLTSLRGKPKLPDDMIIQWERFLSGGENENMARSIDTRMVEPLRNLLNEEERPVPGERRLAVQDLKRGYMMRIPTGQALAARLGLPVMPAGKIKEAIGDEQFSVLNDSGFSERTPLWFYILAEAAAEEKGHRLGPLGRRLVSEVLVGLVRVCKDSILPAAAPRWTPTLKGSVKGEFDLADLLRLAGVLND